MRFLLHSQDAVYDATTKTYYYRLTNPLNAPTTLIIEHVNYISIDSTQIVKPHVVYMRSKSLSNLFREKHSVIVKSANDVDIQSDVVAMLSESHAVGRYENKAPLEYKLNPNTFFRTIDIYFTDAAGVVLDGVYSPPAVSGSVYSDIEAEFTAVWFLC